MATSQQLHRLATHPREYVKFATTGELPQGKRPTGPLIDLLKQLSPRDLQSIRGVTVDQRLGYTGSRQFPYASQALRWVAPSEEVFDSFAADSWRNKRFQQRLYLDDLAECCKDFPSRLLDQYPRLRKPLPKSSSGAIESGQ